MSHEWTLTSKHASQLQAMEVVFLWKIEGKTSQDRVRRNTTIRNNLGLKPLRETLEENSLRWFRHVLRMPADRIARQNFERRVDERSSRGCLRKTWEEHVREAFMTKNLD